MLVLGEGKIKASADVLQEAKGPIFDVKIVGEGAGPGHNVSGAVRVELPPHRSGERKRLSVKLDLAEEEKGLV